MIVLCIYHVRTIKLQSPYAISCVCCLEKEVDSLMEELLKTVRILRVWLCCIM